MTSETQRLRQHLLARHRKIEADAPLSRLENRHLELHQRANDSLDHDVSDLPVRGGPDVTGGRSEYGPVIIRTYDTARAYEEDAPRMMAKGYSIQSQTGATGQINAGRTALQAAVFIPWALLRPSRRVDRFVVTWVRSTAGEETSK